MKFRPYFTIREQPGPIGSDPQVATDSLARTWLESLETPFAIVDQNLGLYWCNPAGHRQLQAKHAFEAKDSTFAPVDPAYRPGLNQFVASARQVASHWSFPWAAGHVLLRATEIHRNHLHRYLGLQFSLTTQFEAEYSNIDRAFCLTGQESRIVSLLLKSKRPEHIASELHLRVPTVRTHVRNIYAKLGVKNSAELFHSVAPFRVI